MKLDLSTLSALCPTYKSAVGIEGNCLLLTAVPAVSRCEALVYAEFAFNLIVDIAPLALCGSIWVLDLRGNRIRDVAPIGNFVALGTLVLTSNPIPVGNLSSLKHTYILNLHIPVFASPPTLPRKSHKGAWTVNAKYQSEPTLHADFDLSVRKNHSLLISELAQKAIFIAGIDNATERTKAKLAFLWEDWVKGEKEREKVACFGRRQRKKVQRNVDSLLGRSAEVRELLACALNLYMEGLITKSWLDSLVISVENSGKPKLATSWIADLPLFLMVGLTLSLRTAKIAAILTIEDIIQMDFLLVSSHSVDERVRKIAQISRELLLRLSNAQFPINSSEEILTTLRQYTRNYTEEVKVTPIERSKSMEIVKGDWKDIRNYHQSRLCSRSSVHCSATGPIIVKPKRSQSIATAGNWLLELTADCEKKVLGGEVAKTRSFSRPKTAIQPRKLSRATVVRPVPIESHSKVPSNSLSIAAVMDCSSLSVTGKGGKATPCFDFHGHFQRVYSREATPWVAYCCKGRKVARKGRSVTSF